VKWGLSVKNKWPKKLFDQHKSSGKFHVCQTKGVVNLTNFCLYTKRIRPSVPEIHAMQNREFWLFLAIFGIFRHFPPFPVAHISRTDGPILLV
jgi:hypothetical protein